MLADCESYSEGGPRRDKLLLASPSIRRQNGRPHSCASTVLPPTDCVGHCWPYSRAVGLGRGARLTASTRCYCAASHRLCCLPLFVLPPTVCAASLRLCCLPQIVLLLCYLLQIVWGTAGGRLPEVPAGSNCRVVSLEQVESLGRRHARAHIPPKPSDVATLCYTSGTTGVPKGEPRGRAGGRHSHCVAFSHTQLRLSGHCRWAPLCAFVCWCVHVQGVRLGACTCVCVCAHTQSHY